VGYVKRIVGLLAPAMSQAVTASHLLRRFVTTTLSFSSARRRNLFRSSPRLNGPSNIGIASETLVASDQQVWYPCLRASRRWDTVTAFN